MEVSGSAPAPVSQDEAQAASGAPELPPLRAQSDTPASPGEPSVWKARIRDFEAEAEAAGDGPEAALLYLEVGRIWEEMLGELVPAATAYERAFRLAPRDPAVLHAAQRLFAEVGNWTMLVDKLLPAEIDIAASAEARATLWAELGMLLEDKLSQPENAQAAYRRALSLWPAEPLALQSLERHYLVQQEFAELLLLYEAALQSIEGAEQRLPLLVAAAQLAEDRFEDASRSLALYRQVLSIDPGHGLALSALRRLLDPVADQGELVAVLERSAERAPSRAEAADYLCQAARILRASGAPEQALRYFLRALERKPADLGVLREIEHLYETNAHYEDAAKVLRRAIDLSRDDRARAALLAKLGEVLETRLEQWTEAEAAYREAVQLQPEGLSARQALGRLLARREDWDGLEALLGLELGLDEPDAIRAQKYLRRAQLRWKAKADAEGAISDLESALSIRSDDLAARKMLQDLLTRTGQWAKLTAHLERELDARPESAAARELWHQLAALYEGHEIDLARAEEILCTLLDEDGTDLRAIRALVRIHERKGEWPRVLELTGREAAATDDQREVVDLLYRAGSIADERMQDVAVATDYYKKVLLLAPDFVPALRSLGALYRRQGRWDALIEMHEQELSQNLPDAKRIDLLFRVAEIELHHRGDAERAVAVLQQILAVDPDHAPTLRALVPLYETAGDWPALFDVLSRQIPIVADPEESTILRLRAAEVASDRLDRGDLAAELYQALIREGEYVDRSVRALVRIYSQEGMWNALSGALHKAAEQAQDPSDRRAVQLRMAEVLGDKLGHLDAAADALEGALTTAPADEAALQQLERLSLARRDFVRAVAIGEQLAATERDPTRLAARHIRLAALKEHQIEPPGDPSPNYRAALVGVPQHPVARRALERLYREAHDWQGLAAYYAWASAQAESDGVRAGFAHRAADIFEHRLGDMASAEQYYRVAIAAKPELPSLRSLRELLQRQGRTQELAPILEAEASRTKSAKSESSLRFAAAEALAAEGADVEAQIAAYEQVVALEPTHEPSLHRLEALWEATGRWQALAKSLEARAERADAHGRSELWRRAADVWQFELAEPERAVACLRSALEDRAEDPVLSGRIGRMLADIGSTEEARRYLALAAEHLPDADEKAEVLSALAEMEVAAGDAAAAAGRYGALLAIRPKDVTALARLAALYEGAGDFESAANALIGLADAEPSPEAKAESLVRLASVYQDKLSDGERAQRALEKAQQAAPARGDIGERLRALYRARGDWSGLAGLLEARLDAALSADASEAWLSDWRQVVQAELGDAARYRRGLDRLAAQGGDSPALLSGLAAAYELLEDATDKAIALHQRVLQLNPLDADSHRALHRAHERAGRFDRAFVAAEILVFLRAAAEDEMLYYEEHKGKVAPEPRRSLTPEEWCQRLLGDAERAPLWQVLHAFATDAAKHFPATVSELPLARGEKFRARASLPARQVADALQTALLAPPFDLWVVEEFETEVRVAVDRQAVLAVSDVVAKRLQETERRFVLAGAVARLAAGEHIIGALGPAGLGALLGRIQGVGEEGPDDDGTVRKIYRGLPSAVRARVAEHIGRDGIAAAELAAYSESLPALADRAGLIFTNDVAVAVRHVASRTPGVRPVFATYDAAVSGIGQIDAVRRLLAFAASEDYAALRAGLGFAIDA